MSQHDFDSSSHERPGEETAANQVLFPADQPVLSTDDEGIVLSDQPPRSLDEETNDVSERTEEEASSEEAAPEQLPPEAQGEVNGGPLGCCLGTTVGLFLSLSIAILSRLYSTQLGALFQQNYGLMGALVRVLMGLLAIVLAILCGRAGWLLGKRFYREYEPPVVKMRKSRFYRQK